MSNSILENLAGWPLVKRDRVFYLAALPATLIVVGIAPYLFQAVFFTGMTNQILALSIQVAAGAAIMGIISFWLTKALSMPRLWGATRHKWPLVNHILILWIPAFVFIDFPLRLKELGMLGPAALTQESMPYILGVSFGRAFLFSGGIVFYERLMGAVSESASLRQKTLLLETQTLKTLIQPHFMLNSLGAIRANIEEAPQIAEQMILSLTSILSMVIDFSGKDRITMREEMRLVEEYVVFMNRRFESEVKLDVEDRVHSDVSVPPLIIFNLVENSFKHGFSEDRSGTISIKAEASEMFRITVDDDGAQAKEAAMGGGSGAQYVASRLELAYGERFTFTHGRIENGHYQAVIEIPWKGEYIEP